MLILLIIISLLIYFIIVRHSPNRVISTSFYYWNTNYDLDSNQQNYLDSLKCHKLYVRFFDVDFDKQNKRSYPIANINNINKNTKLEIIPVIYILNRTMINIENSQIEDLSRKIFSQITYLYDSTKIKEIQFDCDWTQKSKDKYFKFLQIFKQQYPKYKLSATIRLHQVKYKQESGIPPIDKAVLMAYNIDRIGDLETKNSILSYSSIKAYLNSIAKYPLKLDIALPLYSQGIVFRYNKAQYLISDLYQNQITNLLKDTNKFDQISKNKYKSKSNQYFNSNYIYINDIIRIEKTSLDELEFIASEISERIQSEKIEIIYFRLDQEISKEYSVSIIEKINSQFR